LASRVRHLPLRGSKKLEIVVILSRSQMTIPHHQLLRSIVAAALATTVIVGCTRSEQPTAPTAPDTAEQVRRLASILDYIAADYPGCVDDGRITVQEEYDEQLLFLKDAIALAQALPAPSTPIDTVGLLEGLRKQVDGVAPADGVTRAARSLSKQLLTTYDVVIAPSAPPSFERGRSLYAENCAPCHGDSGAGNGPRAAELEGPKPRSLLDTNIMDGMSPTRAYNTVTDGVADTAMASFDLLSQSDRWSLAFFVMTLRHDAQAAADGEALFQPQGLSFAKTPSGLSNQTDAELLASITSTGADNANANKVLAFLRRTAPYHLGGAPLDLARERLGTAIAAYRTGDKIAARREAASAYLDGFEPHEAALAGIDEQLVIRLEAEFLTLREAIGAGEAAATLEQRALRIGSLLDTADRLLSGEGGAKVAFVSSLLIVLREGLEGALLVLLLLSIARRSGTDERDIRAVHIGWISALGLGVITWLASGALIEAIGGASRELIEGVVAILAAVVLLAVSHFVLARLDVRRRIAALRNKLATAASSPQRRLFLAGLGFVAVYREAFETVLFLRAIMLDAGVSVLAVAGGALVGVALLICVVIAMTKLGKRLKPAPLLSALGMMLCLLAVVLVGKGMRSLQEAGILDITPLGTLRIDWLGMYPTTQTTLAQFGVAAAFALIAVWAALKMKPKPKPAAA
jgi:high-affinity iron transporter